MLNAGVLDAADRDIAATNAWAAVSDCRHFFSAPSPGTRRQQEKR
jgi:hypothetical protein